MPKIMKLLALTTITSLLAVFLAGCEDKGARSDAVDAAPAAEDADPSDSTQAAVDAEVSSADEGFPDAQPLPMRAACNAEHPPVVMVHGFLASSDTWAGHVQRFSANGFCPDRFHAFDWNTLDRNADHIATLDAFIETVRTQHGAETVDLMGHSAGGGLGMSYLETAERALKVRRYVHIGSFPAEGPAGPPDASVPTLNLWSPDDRAVEGADIPGADNVQIAGDDHYAVATSDRSFAAIFEFLTDAMPERLDAQTEEAPIISGRMVTLGENRVEEGGRVDVWVLEANSPQRASAVRRFEVGMDGRWGPFVADPSVRYELHGVPADEEAPSVRYFREAFTVDQPLAYLRTLPGPGSIASVLLSLLPLDGESVPLVIYNARSAFLVGRDSLTLDGVELLTEQSASAENTSIALFVFDVGTDGESGATSPLFDMFPFLAAIDLPIEPNPGEAMSLVFNGRTILLPRDPPTQGIAIAVFD